MNLQAKEISFKTTNTYATLNTFTETTKTVWFVCHGMGYLSRYFLKYFKALDAEQNYIIAPQAPSKYYIQPKMHVGANWLTKDNTVKDTENIMQYFDAIFEAEKISNDTNFIVLGYSQSVSVAMRYLAKRQLHCEQLIIHSGGVPKELTATDFKYMSEQTKVKLVYGTEDEYLDANRIEEETTRAHTLFGKRASFHPFKGKHVVNVEFINTLV